MKQIVIIGGGLAGLVNSILLARNGIAVTLYEKKQYPFHKVCGEYVSNEVVPFLQRAGLYPNGVELPKISQFQFTSTKGKSLEMALDLGGFGISRYLLDDFLKQKALQAGAEIREKTSVSDVSFHQDHFRIKLSNQDEIACKLVIGAYGKRSTIDQKMNRSFTRKRSPFIGVKYHIKTDFAKDKIALHNFEKGYCGISAIEDEKFNLCYLGSRDKLREHGSIQAYEETVVKQNPFLREIFKNADFLFDKPEVINEFSFKAKSPVEDHVLMSGDTAGLITPLCGNGMAMAIHSAEILSDIVLKNHTEGNFDRQAIEAEYTQRWNKTFRQRLWVGRKTQLLFGSKMTSELAVNTMQAVPFIARAIMKGTHGSSF